MKNYIFSQLLSPDDFQDLAVQVLQIRENRTMECFRKVKDLGIDALDKNSKGLVVMQAKRYSHYNNLYNSLKINELPKVKNLKPERYILITSVDFGPEEKNRIMQLFSGFIKNEKDILGQADLNNLLSKPEYKQIVLDDSEILEEMLDKIINRGIYQASKNELRNIIKNEETYIESDLYKNAVKILEKQNCILITGEAGIGKTALARHLCYTMLQEKNSVNFYYVYSLDSIFQVFQDNKEQIFFLDDFWGSIFKESTDKTEEKKFTDLINMFTADKSKKLILTSRDYILKQGFKEHPKIGENFTEKTERKLILQLEKFSKKLKIEILFKHLKQSNLQWKMVKQIADNCDQIISQQGYNPRLIVDFLHKASNDIEAGSIYDVYQELINYLKNPTDFIKDIFTEQTSTAQLILLLIVTKGRFSYLDEVENMFYDYIKYTKIVPEANFETCMQQLTSDFLREEEEDIEWKQNPIRIEFQNPSFKEYVNEYLCKHARIYMENIINSTRYINVLQTVLNNHMLGDYKEVISEKIIKDYPILCISYGHSIFDKETQENSEVDKLLKLIQLNEKLQNPKVATFLKITTQQIINSIQDGTRKLNNEDMDAFIYLLRDIPKEYDITMDGKKLIEAYVKNITLAEHYTNLSEFAEVFPIEYATFMQKNHNKIRQLLPNLIMSNAVQYRKNGQYKELSFLVDMNYNELKRLYSLPFDRKFENILNANVKKYAWNWEKRTIKLKSPTDIKGIWLENEKKKLLGGYQQTFNIMTPAEIEEELKQAMSDIPAKERKDLLQKMQEFSYEELKQGVDIFSEKSLTQHPLFQNTPELIEMLISNGILYKSKNWIQYINYSIHAYLALQAIKEKKKDITAYVKSIQSLMYPLEPKKTSILLQLNEEMGGK